MFFADALTLDAPRRTADGYLAVRAKAARTGVYKYTGREVDPDNKHGLRDQAIVNVLRDEETVFDTAAARSFIGKPVTDDHPASAVNSANWRDHARGVVMGALRDGDYLAFDLLLTDADTIAKVDAGKRELSNGYAAELQFGDFKAADGTPCPARQSKITGGNHVAVVKFGRAGEECAIRDAFALCDANPNALPQNDGEPIVTTKTITFDGLPLLVTDAAEAAIGKLQGQIATATETLTARDASIVERDATIVARDADIVRLTAELADANDPAKRALRDAALRDAMAKAKALGVTVTDAMLLADVQKAVVLAKMPDKAPTYDAAKIAIAFDGLTVGVKIADTVVQPLGAPRVVTDGAAAIASTRAGWLSAKQNAHRAQPAS